MHTHPPNVVIKSAGKCQIALFYIDVVIGSRGNQQQGRMLLFCLFSLSAVLRLFTCFKSRVYVQKIDESKTFVLTRQPDPVQLFSDEAKRYL